MQDNHGSRSRAMNNWRFATDRQWSKWALAMALASVFFMASHSVAGQDLAGVPAGAQSQSRLNAPSLDKEKAMSMKVKGKFTLAAAGDLLDFHPVAKRANSDVQAI